MRNLISSRLVSSLDLHFWFSIRLSLYLASPCLAQSCLALYRISSHPARLVSRLVWSRLGLHLSVYLTLVIDAIGYDGLV